MIESFGLPTANGSTPSSSIFFLLRFSLVLYTNSRRKRRSARREILPIPIPTIAPVESFFPLEFPSLFREALLLLLLEEEGVVVMFPTGMVTPVSDLEEVRVRPMVADVFGYGLGYPLVHLD
jgi:hypothetical protein